MGNVLSDEDDRDDQFLEEGFNLESPDADKAINYGTAAPVWQNKSNSNSITTSESQQQQQQQQHRDDNNNSNSNKDSNNSKNHAGSDDAAVVATTGSDAAATQRRGSNNSGNHNNNNNNNNNSNNNNNDSADDTRQSQPKKLSYIQMAKLGYQELVNAIIRPPRADYKVNPFSFCVVIVDVDGVHEIQ
jgi:hypothetical protein